MRPIKGSHQPKSSQASAPAPALHQNPSSKNKSKKKKKKKKTQVSNNNNTHNIKNSNNIPTQSQTQIKNKSNKHKNKKTKIRHGEEVIEPQTVLLGHSSVIKEDGTSHYSGSTSSADGSTSADDVSNVPSFSNESDGDADSKKGSQSDDEQDVVYADFEFFDPKQDDFHGIRNLLKTYLEGMNWDLSGFVDILLAQTTVGTVIKTDEDSLFGVITALNLDRYKDHRCMKDLQKFLLDKSSGMADNNGLRACLEEHPQDVGLLVCERVVNLPFELIPPLYDALFDEVSWATEDEPTQALRDSFQFKHYLIFTKVYQTIQDMEKESNVETRLKEKKKRKNNSLRNKGNGHTDQQQAIYIKPEDEIFHQLCSWSFKFPVDAEYQPTHEFKDLKMMRLVMAVKVEKIPTFRTKLKAFIDES